VLPGILRTLIVLLPLLIVLAHVGAVHGAQDAPDLMQTLVAKDATLNNELDLIEMRWVPGRDRRELASGFGVEKIVANNLASLLLDHPAEPSRLKRAQSVAAMLRRSQIPQFKDTLGWAS